MRHLQTESQMLHALFALQDADGYVEALLGLARDRVTGRRYADTQLQTRGRADTRKASTRSRAYSL
jgi:hypothetical protein